LLRAATRLFEIEDELPDATDADSGRDA
jgi:hypothetical protein